MKGASEWMVQAGAKVLWDRLSHIPEFAPSLSEDLAREVFAAMVAMIAAEAKISAQRKRDLRGTCTVRNSARRWLKREGIRDFSILYEEVEALHSPFPGCVRKADIQKIIDRFKASQNAEYDL